MNPSIEDPPVRGGITQYGFNWGPMEVSRLVHIEGKGYVLEVKTKHQSIQIYVTEKGRKVKAYPIRGLHGSR